MSDQRPEEGARMAAAIVRRWLAGLGRGALNPSWVPVDIDKEVRTSPDRASVIEDHVCRTILVRHASGSSNSWSICAHDRHHDRPMFVIVERCALHWRPGRWREKST